MFSAIILSVILCTVVSAAPARVITYNQLQNGTNNLHADVENVLILIVPSRKLIGSAISVIDFKKSMLTPSRKHIPEAPEIAIDFSQSSNPLNKKEESSAPMKAQDVPEPPEPAETTKVPEPVQEVTISTSTQASIKPQETISTQASIKPQETVSTQASIKPQKTISTSTQASIKPQETTTANILERQKKKKPVEEASGSRRSPLVAAKLLGFGVVPAVE